MTKESTNDALETARYLLHRTVLRYGAGLLEDHPWVWETARWRELVFAIFAHPTPMSHSDLHDLTVQMEAMGLLDVQVLAKLAEGEAQLPIHRHPRGRCLVLMLEEAGYKSEPARRRIETVARVALMLRNRFNGKIQRYLRSHGERMIDDLYSDRSATEGDGPELANAFTYWLQNVVSMPLSLFDDNVERFCTENKLKKEDLYAAADDLDFSFAFVDDLIQQYYMERATLSEVE